MKTNFFDVNDDLHNRNWEENQFQVVSSHYTRLETFQYTKNKQLDAFLCMIGVYWSTTDLILMISLFVDLRELSGEVMEYGNYELHELVIFIHGC